MYVSVLQEPVKDRVRNIEAECSRRRSDVVQNHVLGTLAGSSDRRGRDRFVGSAILYHQFWSRLFPSTAGSVNEIVVPSPGSESTQISPP